MLKQQRWISEYNKETTIGYLSLLLPPFILPFFFNSIPIDSWFQILISTNLIICGGEINTLWFICTVKSR